MINGRLAICAAASVLAHYAIARGLERLPSVAVYGAHRTIEIRMVTPTAPLLEPEPEAPKPELPPPPLVEPPLKPPPRPRTPPPRVVAPIQAVTPIDTPPTLNPPTGPTTNRPTFGVSMESTSQSGRGPAMAVGNNLEAGPAGTAPQAATKALASPVAAFEVTKMPLPQGRCSGKYTDEARTAALEDVVILDLTVDERGRARDIAVVTGLGHGLTEAAIAALTACTFTPGEKGGAPVPVRVRGFKIRFQLQDPL